MIYGFRGANIQSVFTLIENMDFKHFTLGRNYRSTQTIVSAARSVIENNSMQLEKTVFTQNEKGDKIVYYELPDTNAEALQVVKVIMALTRQRPTSGREKVKAGDIAILYRMSYLSRSIEEYLLRNGIKYTIVGGAPFYARKEIKDVLAYVRFLVNPSDQQAFLRIINTPKRKLGEKALEQVFDCFNKLNHVNIESSNALIQACNDVQLKGVAKKGMENFIATITHLSNFIDANGSSPRQVIEEIVRVTNYTDYLIESEKEKAEEKIANVVELAEIATSYSSLEDFIANMVLNNAETDTTEDAEEDKVKLLTMHSSKGLEFPIVIIVGANEGIVPHHKADTVESIDEERRLFYVAMTRAMKGLFITRSKVMPMNGVPYHCKSSRFVNEIDSEYVRKL